MSVVRKPHCTFLYLVLTAIALGLAAAIVWMRVSIERPVPRPSSERQGQRVSLRADAPRTLPRIRGVPPGRPLRVPERSVN
jgi:hypothetical protein